MIAPNPSIPDKVRWTPCVEDVLAELRILNSERPEISRLEVHEIHGVLRRRGCYADVGTVESAAGWLLVDALEITA